MDSNSVPNPTEFVKYSITAERLRELYNYDPSTGSFSKLGRRLKLTPYPDGYARIVIQKKIYLAHRLAWLYIHGRWPEFQIDHINGNKSDNRLSNLREATQAQNCQNYGAKKTSKSGIKGVFWHKQCRKWTAQIKVGYKAIHLGLFDSLSDAKDARIEAQAKYHPFAQVQS